MLTMLFLCLQGLGSRLGGAFGAGGGDGGSVLGVALTEKTDKGH